MPTPTARATNALPQSARGVVTRRAYPHTGRAMEGAAAADNDDSDEALMLAYGAGHAGAFDTLYARHKGGVYRYLLRHLRNAGTTDELFQDVWMNAIRARSSYVPTAKFTTWLYTLARHRLVDHWRAQGQAVFVSIDDDNEDSARTMVEALPASSLEEPRRARKVPNSALRCAARSPRCRPSSAMRSCCNTKAACRLRRSRRRRAWAPRPSRAACATPSPSCATHWDQCTRPGHE